MDKADKAKSPAAAKKHKDVAARLHQDYVEKLANLHVLDPACGSGNFLYLALNQDERGRRVFDAVWPHVPGARRGEVNLRFGQERTVRREWVFSIGNLFNAPTIYWLDFPAVGRTYRLDYAIRF